MPQPLLPTMLLLGAIAAVAPGSQAPCPCSAAKLSPHLTPQRGLPPAVARMRQAIADAAVACDFAKLQSLAHSRYGFRIGFDEKGSFQRYLKEHDSADAHLMKHLIDLLNQPYTTGTQVDYKTFGNTDVKNYFWPKVDLPPDRYFYGYFITITEDGQWTAFGNAD